MNTLFGVNKKGQPEQIRVRWGRVVTDFPIAAWVLFGLTSLSTTAIAVILLIERLF